MGARPLTHGSKTRFADSSNGKTPGSGPGDRGSSPRSAASLAHMRAEYRNLCDRIELLMSYNVRDAVALRQAEDRKRTLGLQIAVEERRTDGRP